MILDADVIIEAFRRAMGDSFRAELLCEKAVRAAVLDARQLARVPAEEIVALFFAFARRPRAFHMHAGPMTEFLTRDQADRVSLTLTVTLEELEALRWRIIRGETDFSTVREWFAERIST